MKKLLTLFICSILFIFSVDAQYKWIERKYGKPFDELADIELQIELNRANRLLYIGVGSLVGGTGLAIIGFHYGDENWNYLYLGLLGGATAITGLFFIAAGYDRGRKLNNPQLYGIANSSIYIHPLLCSIGSKYCITPGLTLCIRF